MHSSEPSQTRRGEQSAAYFNAHDRVHLAYEHPAVARRLNLWVHVGDQDVWHSSVADLQATLERSGVQHIWRTYPGGHDGEYWTAPTTNIGSATPVTLGQHGEQALSPETRAKVTNDAMASIRALADKHGRDAEFAERAIRDGANVDALTAWRMGVVNFLAADVTDLLRQADGAAVETSTGEITLRTADATVERAGMSAIEQFLLVITNPTVAYLLLSLGGLALILELYNPGSIFPGIVGGISLLLALYGLGTLPANYAGLGLLGVGLVLVALEPLIASRGILGAGGAVAFIAGSLLLTTVPAAAPYLRISLWAVAAASGLFVLFAMLVVGSILRARRRQVVTGREALVGKSATVRRPISPGERGLVQLQGELWQASAGNAEISQGGTVVVEGTDGLLLHVRPLAGERSEIIASSLDEKVQRRIRALSSTAK